MTSVETRLGVPGLPRRWAPSPTAIVFILLALAVPILLQKPVLNSDGDLARHLAHGRYMLDHRQLIRSDPFSFTRPGASFVAFEYGSQLLYAVAEQIGGLPAVAVLAGLLIALTYGLLTRLLLRSSVDPLLACLTVGMAIALGIEHWNARPHLFTYVCVILLLGWLERPPRRPLLHCGALFLLWANLHGGFVYGWVLIGLYGVGSLGELARDKRDPTAWKARLRHYISLLAVAVVVTLLTPHRLDLHRHLIEFFSQTFVMRNTAEFVSPDFHEPSGKVFLAILLLTFGSIALTSRRPNLPHFLVTCAGAAFALMSVRNIPLFGLTVLPLWALHIDAAWRRLPDPGGMRERFGIGSRQTTTLPWGLAVTALLCGLAVSRGRVGSVQVIQTRFDPTIFPAQAVARARAANLKGHLFAEFSWGGYLLYSWPEQKIFIDGGTDFFGEEIFREYLLIKRMEPGWRDHLRRREISLVLLRRNSGLAHELARDAGWGIWYCDSLATLLHRNQAVETWSQSSAEAAEARLDGCGGSVRPR